MLHSELKKKLLFRLSGYRLDYRDILQIIGISTRLSGYRETVILKQLFVILKQFLVTHELNLWLRRKHVNINSEKLQNPKKNDFGTYVMIWITFAITVTTKNSVFHFEVRVTSSSFFQYSKMFKQTSSYHKNKKVKSPLITVNASQLFF